MHQYSANFWIPVLGSEKQRQGAKRVGEEDGVGGILPASPSYT